MKKLKIFSAILIVMNMFLIPSVGCAGTGEDVAYATRGAGKIVGSVFAIPKAMWQDSGRVMFPFGLVTGAVRGAVQTVTGVVSGTVDVARGGAPYAKYAALAL